MSSIGSIGEMYYKTKIHARALREQNSTKQKVERKYKVQATKCAKKIKSEPISVVFKDLLKTQKVIVSNEEILYNKLISLRESHRDEIKLHGEQTALKEGFVYIITNNIWPDWVKAGMAFDYERRLDVYNQSDPLKSFKIEGLMWTKDRRKLERILLGNLSVKAESQNGEWFHINKNLALETFYNSTL